MGDIRLNYFVYLFVAVLEIMHYIVRMVHAKYPSSLIEQLPTRVPVGLESI